MGRAALPRSAEREAHHRLISVQAGRGVAALLVVLYHAGRMVALPQYLGHVPLGGVFGFGHAGVDFFFVLSGFIIMFVHRPDLGRPDRLPRYLWRRLTRIYPIYWVVTAMVIAIALASPDRAERLRPLHVLASLLLVPHGEEPLLGVAWTLEHEMLFYLAFALAILRLRLGVALAAAAVALVAAGQLVPFRGFLGFLATSFHLQFLVGIGCAVLVRSGRVRAPRSLALAGTAAFLAAGLAENAGVFARASLAEQLVFGVASAAVLVGVATAEQRGTLRFGRIAALLGAASYSIYLVHTLTIGLTARGMARVGLLQVLPDWGTLFVVVAVAVGCAVALYLLVERPLTASLQPLGPGGGRRALHPIAAELPAVDG